jgi:hypothetical protein
MMMMMSVRACVRVCMCVCVYSQEVPRSNLGQICYPNCF